MGFRGAFVRYHGTCIGLGVELSRLKFTGFHGSYVGVMVLPRDFIGFHSIVLGFHGTFPNCHGLSCGTYTDFHGTFMEASWNLMGFGGSKIVTQ